MATNDEDQGFTAEERAAMKERARETRPRKGGAKVDPEAEVLAKIAELPDDDRVIAERIHALVAEHAPSFTPRTWYGMPAYAKDGKVAVFVQPASKFKARYATLGFNDSATLDDGSMWATSFAITTLTAADEKRIAELIARAAG